MPLISANNLAALRNFFLRNEAISGLEGIGMRGPYHSFAEQMKVPKPKQTIAQNAAAYLMQTTPFKLLCHKITTKLISLCLRRVTTDSQYYNWL